MPAYQRRKGIRVELEEVHAWQAVGFKDAKRHLESQAAEADEGRDLDNTGCFLVQVKGGKQVPKKVYDALEQVKPKEGHYQIAVLKRDNKKRIICMYHDDFMELLRLMILEGIIKT